MLPIHRLLPYKGKDFAGACTISGATSLDLMRMVTRFAYPTLSGSAADILAAIYFVPFFDPFINLMDNQEVIKYAGLDARYGHTKEMAKALEDLRLHGLVRRSEEAGPAGEKTVYHVEEWKTVNKNLCGCTKQVLLLVMGTLELMEGNTSIYRFIGEQVGADLLLVRDYLKALRFIPQEDV